MLRHLRPAWLVALSLSFAANLDQGSASYIGSRQANACSMLTQKYPNITIGSSNSDFQTQVVENWSQTCQTAPQCMFFPASADQVAGGLQILHDLNQTFAIRTQGHMPIPGASNSDSVLLVTTSLNTVQYTNDSKSVVRVGAGNTWENVYNVLAQDRLGVAGGRFGPVGVSGLLLGGGINYFGSEFGWGCSTVVKYEVVLANGTIVEATATEHSDLFWALKGGSSNFGIVTRFDMKTFPVPFMWGGDATYNSSAVGPIVDAWASFAVASGGSSDAAAHADTSILYNVTTGEVTIVATFMHRGNDPNPASLKNFTDVPAVTKDFRVAETILGLKNDTNIAAFALGNRRQLFSSTALASSAEAVALVNQTYFEMIESSEEIKTVTDLSVTNLYQLFTPGMINAAKAAGGDAIGLENPNENGVLSILYGANWADAKDDETVYAFMQKLIDQLDANSKKAGLYYDFIYLNDAAPTQTKDVFQKYAGGASLPKLKQVAQAYDPDEVFQKLTPGGFKLSNTPGY